MGVSMSTRRAARARARSDIIDRQIEEDDKRLKRRCRILLLGTSGSGKSTILKQIKIAYQHGFSTSELADFRPTVYKNVLESAQAVIMYMRKVGLECSDATNSMHCQEILNYKLDTSPGSVPHFPPSIADAIHQLWKDPIMVKTMDEHLGHFYLMDNAAYFFDEVLRIGMPEYVPNMTDVLHAYRKSVGPVETEVFMSLISVPILDIGGQHYRIKKLLHCFESMTCIIFCAALSDYDQVLLEDKSQSWMSESLMLFDSVINSRWFTRTSFILYLTKIDVFRKKLRKVPFGRYFPGYTGGDNINIAAKCILWRFMQANRARLSVYPHLIQATDTTDSNSVRPIFTAVKETILQNALKDSNIQ